MREKQLKLFYNEGGRKEEMKQGRRTLTIPVDTFILMVIIVLFIIVTSFSLGVKQGEKVFSASEKITLAKSEVKPETKNVSIAESSAKRAISSSSDTSGENDNNNDNNDNNGNNGNNDENNKKEENNKRYVIQVASYLKESIAEKEKQYLKKKGLSAEVSKKGKYLVLYVGKFNTKENAEKIKTSLEKRYGDCFIRRL